MRSRAASFIVARANIGIRYRRYKTAARFADFSKSRERPEEEGQELCTGELRCRNTSAHALTVPRRVCCKRIFSSYRRLFVPLPAKFYYDRRLLFTIIDKAPRIRLATSEMKHGGYRGNSIIASALPREFDKRRSVLHREFYYFIQTAHSLGKYRRHRRVQSVPKN